MIRKFLGKILVFTSIVVLVPFSFTYAVASSACSPVVEAFTLSDLWFGANIMKTIQDATVAGGNVFLTDLGGGDADQIVRCDWYLEQHIDAKGQPLYPQGVCGDESDAAVCEQMMNFEGESNSSLLNYNIRERGVKGSLIGFAYSLENISYKEPLAVNLAYFWNRNVEKLPIIGPTFAAGESGYNMGLLDSAYNLWEMVRDVALALISVVLLYTGIMIIMRKRVNSQLVVNVQYAIPKIIIGMVLIIFSYPIGAAITGLSWGLFRSAPSIVGKASGHGTVTTGQLYLLILNGVIKNSLGLSRIVLALIVGLIVAIMTIVVYVKAILIYLKMVIAVVTGPFEMAVGTIPGSESMIKNWFKRMAKLGLSVFAMGAAIPMVLVLAFEMLINYRAASDVGGLGSLFRVIVPPLVVIYGFALALGMEKTIAKFFDDKKR